MVIDFLRFIGIALLIPIVTYFTVKFGRIAYLRGTEFFEERKRYFNDKRKK